VLGLDVLLDYGMKSKVDSFSLWTRRRSRLGLRGNQAAPSQNETKLTRLIQFILSDGCLLLLSTGPDSP